jgi:hypothetical protein
MEEFKKELKEELRKIELATRPQKEPRNGIALGRLDNVARNGQSFDTLETDMRIVLDKVLEKYSISEDRTVEVKTIVSDLFKEVVKNRLLS